MMGDDRRVDDSFRRCIEMIRKSPMVHVPRHTIVIQFQHGDFPFDHRVVTWGDGLGLVYAPHRVLAC